MKKIFLFVLLVISLVGPLNSVAQPVQVLKVGVIPVAPFAFVEDNQLQGIAVDIWRQAASKIRQPYQFVILNENVQEAIEKLSSGKLDALIGPIGITPSRVQLVYFGLPYFTSKEVFASKPIKSNVYAEVNSVLHGLARESVIGFFILFLIYINLFCFLEYEKNKENQQAISYWQNLHEAMWQVILQRKTIPFYPKSIYTRMISLVWTLMSTLFFASVTATITASFVMLTSNQSSYIRTISDLENKKIAVISGSYDEKKARDLKLNIIPALSLDQALNLLEANKADAVLSGQTFMKYAIQKKDLQNLHFSPLVIGTLNYAFAFHKNLALIKDVNTVIAQLAVSDGIKPLCQKYLNSIPNDIDSC
jgi:ABC-type amino acid transport substrate-binding protein